MFEEVVGIELPVITATTVARSADQAQAYMTDLIRHKKIDGEKRVFGSGILHELHKRVLSYYPAIAGQFRGDNDVRIAGRKPVKAEELKDRVYLFERWLEDEVGVLTENPEDLEGALRVAAAAHYGVVADLHPFDDGNGRVARALMNGILVLNTREGIFYGIYILPVPIVRKTEDLRELRRIIEAGKTPKLPPYLQALEDSSNSWSLNPLELYIASKWVKSIGYFFDRFHSRYGTQAVNGSRKRLNSAERAIIDKIDERRSRLNQIIEDEVAGKKEKDRIPDFFAQRLRT